jgi:RNA polymerase sigma-70 factor (ECF subfamily)
MSTWEQMLDELVRERGPALVRYAYLFTSNRTAAEDLVQDALTRCFSRDRTCPDGARAEGYVRRAIVTTYIDGYRKRRRLELSHHLMASRESLPAAQDDVAEQVDVRAALDRLSPRERACLVLHYYEDLGVAQIADELGCSVGAVKRYLSEARASFEQALGRPGTPDDRLSSPTRKGADR